MVVPGLASRWWQVQIQPEADHWFFEVKWLGYGLSTLPNLEVSIFMIISLYGSNVYSYMAVMYIHVWLEIVETIVCADPWCVYVYTYWQHEHSVWISCTCAQWPHTYKHSAPELWSDYRLGLICQAPLPT